MTSALRGREGGWSKRDDSTDRLREWDSDKGGRGSKNPKILRTSFKYRPYGQFWTSTSYNVYCKVGKSTLLFKYVYSYAFTYPRFGCQSVQ